MGKGRGCFRTGRTLVSCNLGRDSDNLRGAEKKISGGDCAGVVW